VRENQAVIIKIKDYPEEVRIPPEINGLPVVKIKRGAYSKPGTMSYRHNVSEEIAKQIDESQYKEGYSYYGEGPWLTEWGVGSINEFGLFPDTPGAVEGHAFHFGFALHAVTLPDTFTSIGKGAFSRCIWLSSVTLPDTLTSIGDGAFLHCGLRSITLPDSLVSIGDYAFAYCGSLTSVTIPENVVSIGAGAFCGCRSLEEIRVSEKNPMYFMEDGVLYSRKGEALWCTPSVSEIVLKKNTTAILPYAFQSYRDSALCSVTIPQGVRRIGKGAFLSYPMTGKIIVSEDNKHFEVVKGKLLDKMRHVLCETWGDGH
jgi:hypothetical protein